MAYLAFADAQVAGPVIAPVGFRAAEIQPEPAEVARLSALEWSVVALARKDRLTSLRTPGRIAMAMGAVFGDQHNPRLADPALEALRRIAVLSWHHRYTVPPHEVKAFLAAGFSSAQYELIVDSISTAQMNAQQARTRH